jgi:hypothetical protein
VLAAEQRPFASALPVLGPAHSASAPAHPLRASVQGQEWAHRADTPPTAPHAIFVAYKPADGSASIGVCVLCVLCDDRRPGADRCDAGR